jgi:hypothetical protein
MFVGKMSFYPGATAPGNVNLASPLMTPEAYLAHYHDSMHMLTQHGSRTAK